MAHLIDKDTLVAKIKKLKAELPKNRGYKRNAYNHVLHIIDTLEVKEVDLEKEYKDFIKSDNGRSMFETAKHFFELGLKARQE
jgi:hypothetical protein